MTILKTLAIAAAGLVLSLGAAQAEGQKTAKDVSFSFEGPFGQFDRAQLQRGYKVYKEVCSNCHAMHLMSFRNLSQPGGPEFSEEQVKALAASFQVQDGPNNDGEMFERPGLPSDRFPSPFPNEQAARAANGGAYPPDLSLITKSRPGWYGTINQLINGIGGPQYVYSVLTGYTPDDQLTEELRKEQPEGKYHNPFFANGPWIGMGPPLSDDQVTFDDGTAGSVSQMARDVSAFLAWAAEPKMEERKRTGFMVLIFLGVLALLLYLSMKKVWAKVH
ncbi:cytochrome c1 [Aestuariivirga sp.]|uniref:cytochrome c1 n=1 Tax=Aestuariivirga sp. TaxID=2650926 RepID=UPI0025BAF610|nr:cytochrome c1 [Aestuariivirga sp.]MCA3556233.1 cytochrome c1 [Aestuariivirga sp.]